MNRQPTSNRTLATPSQSANSQAARQQQARQQQARQPTKLFLLVTVPESIGFYEGGMKALKDAGFVPTVVTSPGPELAQFSQAEDTEVIALPMARNPSPFRDLCSLISLIKLLRRERPQIVVAGTPKAGLLGMIGSRVLKIPVRCYLLRGLRLETAEGSKQKLYRLLEVLACRCATHVYAVSPSLRRAALSFRLCDPGKISVIGEGSDHGVDVLKYQFRQDERDLRRVELGLTSSDYVVGFVGRLSKDKGITDLLKIWSEFDRGEDRTHLVVIGGIDLTDPPPAHVEKRLRDDPTIFWLGEVDGAHWYSTFDVLILPTHREGFPNVVLEASACGIPTCAYRVTGAQDAVINGVTGMLGELHDFAAMAGALRSYRVDPDLRRRHGMAAQRRVIERFRTQDVWAQNAKTLAALVGNDVPEP